LVIIACSSYDGLFRYPCLLSPEAILRRIRGAHFALLDSAANRGAQLVPAAEPTAEQRSSLRRYDLNRLEGRVYLSQDSDS
jgi:hypothetical protein